MAIMISFKQPKDPNKIIKLIKGTFKCWRTDEYFIKENDDKIYSKDSNEAVDRIRSGVIDPYFEMTEGEYVSAVARQLKAGLEKIHRNTLCGAY